jgi:hypothetical protein
MTKKLDWEMANKKEAANTLTHAKYRGPTRALVVSRRAGEQKVTVVLNRRKRKKGAGKSAHIEQLRKNVAALRAKKNRLDQEYRSRIVAITRRIESAEREIERLGRKGNTD